MKNKKLMFNHIKEIDGLFDNIDIKKNNFFNDLRIEENKLMRRNEN